jgi:hypothetical protein
MDSYWASVLWEYGLLGLLTMILFLITLFQILLNFYPKNNENPFMKGLYIGHIILFVDFTLESIVATVFIVLCSAFIFFAGIGLIISNRMSNN